MSVTGPTYYPTGPQGYHCSVCGTWVPNGVYHSCGGSPTYYPPVFWPSCEHCWCKKPAFQAGEGEHVQCCKCHTVMAERFISGSAA